ncbi:MAG: class I SAM-dependent methyltransferase [Candidatus Cloacimonetes bacterium]|nr:class I SAM-dependent methyltransferase [Candidatus Cloacimonadota bacterium]MDD3282712.1 class I SAM-dependent methyltransferase [Candidatus Cloacimonadota bacterium]
MHYDPLKDKLAVYVELFPAFRNLFYFMLDVLLLRQRYIKREINRYFDDGFSFFDAGAGFCQYSDYILTKYPAATVRAVDLKTDYLRNYASVAGNRFLYSYADLQEYIPPEKYDMAVAIDILEHIQNDNAVLRNLHNSLKDKGVLIISTPSDLDEAAKFTSEHVRPGYNKKKLEEKLISNGFKILSSVYSYGFWGAISWKLLIKFPLTLYNRNKIFAVLLPIYYAIVFVPAQIMMLLDLAFYNPQGTGIIITARKKH